MKPGIIVELAVRDYAHMDDPRTVIVGQGEFVAYESRFGKDSGPLMSGGPYNATEYAFLAYQALKRTKDLPDNGSGAPIAFEDWVAGIASVLPVEQDEQIQEAIKNPNAAAPADQSTEPSNQGEGSGGQVPPPAE